MTSSRRARLFGSRGSSSTWTTRPRCVTGPTTYDPDDDDDGDGGDGEGEGEDDGAAASGARALTWWSFLLLLAAVCALTRGVCVAARRACAKEGW